MLPSSSFSSDWPWRIKSRSAFDQGLFTNNIKDEHFGPAGCCDRHCTHLSNVTWRCVRVAGVNFSHSPRNTSVRVCLKTITNNEWLKIEHEFENDDEKEFEMKKWKYDWLNLEFNGLTWCEKVEWDWCCR